MAALVAAVDLLLEAVVALGRVDVLGGDAGLELEDEVDLLGAAEVVAVGADVARVVRASEEVAAHLEGVLERVRLLGAPVLAAAREAAPLVEARGGRDWGGGGEAGGGEGREEVGELHFEGWVGLSGWSG